MSQHPSLRVDAVGAKHRNVLKRFERVKTLKEQEKWKDRTTVFNLPKVKSIKVKVKKIKDEGAEEGAAAVPGVAGAVAAPKAGAAKGAAAPKAGGAAGKAAVAPAGKGDKGKK